MQYNNHPKGQDIVSHVNIHAKTDENNKEFTLKEKAIFGSMVLKKIWNVIFQSYGGIPFDDKNNEEEPVLTLDVSEFDDVFSIPDEAKLIKNISIKNKNGIRTNLVRLFQEDIDNHTADSEFLKTPGVPRYFVERGNSIKVYPAFGYGIEEGLNMEFDQGMAYIDPDSDFIKIGIPDHLHPGFAIGVAYFWCKTNKVQRAKILQSDWIEFINELRSYYEIKARRAQKGGRTHVRLATSSGDDFNSFI